MKTALLVLLGAVASAQPLAIMAGSATDHYFQGTACGSYPVSGWSCPYSDANLPAAYPTLRYGQTVSYTIPLAPGFYGGSIVFVEPTKTAAGQRWVTATIQGQTSVQLDIFELAGGADKPYSFPIFAAVNAGVLNISIAGLLGNAVLSAITVAPVGNSISAATDLIVNSLTTVGGGPTRIYLTCGVQPTDTIDGGKTYDAVLYFACADQTLHYLRSSGTIGP